MRAARTARWILVGLFGLAVSPVIGEFSVRLADRIGLLDRPEETAGTLASFISSQGPWLYPLIALVGGLAAGAWIDHALRRFDGSREQSLRDVGYEMLNVSEELADRDGFDELMPRVYSLLIKLDALKVWAPPADVFKYRRGKAFTQQYFALIGRLICDRHFDAARKSAFGAKDDWERRVKEAGADGGDSAPVGRPRADGW